MNSAYLHKSNQLMISVMQNERVFCESGLDIYTLFRKILDFKEWMAFSRRMKCVIAYLIIDPVHIFLLCLELLRDLWPAHLF
jgi:hypothetical protein